LLESDRVKLFLCSVASRRWLTMTHVTNISMKSQWLPVWGKMLVQIRR